MSVALRHHVTDRERPGRAIRALQALTLVAVVAYAAHSGAGLGGRALNALFENWIYNGVIVAGAALALLSAWRHPHERLPWAIMGAGLAFWAAGEIVSTLDPGSVRSASFPSLSDVLWLAFYPAGFATLVLLVRARVREFYPSLWLDGLLGTLTLAAVSAQFVFPPIVAATGDPSTSVVGDLIYPIGDSLLIMFVIGVLATSGWRPGRRLALVSAGFALGAVADSWSLYQSATGHAGSTALDVLWPASALVLGSAAWAHERRATRVELEGMRLLALPIGFAVCALLLLAFGGVQHVNLAAYGLALAALAGVVVRLGTTFYENLKLGARRRRDALTDPLTGLANRRQLLLDLDDARSDATEQRPYRLVMFDLNGFKAYNDSFGHPAGDKLLATLARRLDHVVSDHGRAYRLGGDEFCALYRPGAPATDVAVAAARGALSDRGNGLEITAAYGVAWMPREAHDGAHALELADERLYAQKRRGAARPDHLPDPRDAREEELSCA